MLFRSSVIDDAKVRNVEALRRNRTAQARCDIPTPDSIRFIDALGEGKATTLGFPARGNNRGDYDRRWGDGHHGRRGTPETDRRSTESGNHALERRDHQESRRTLQGKSGTGQ